MLEAVTSFLRDKPFQPFVYHFARQMLRLEGKESPELMLAAGLLCYEVFQGNTLLDLNRYAKANLRGLFPDIDSDLIAPDLESWITKLETFDCVGSPGDTAALILEKDNDRTNLYLFRYWDYENSLAQSLSTKVMREFQEPQLDWSLINRLFDAEKNNQKDETQKSAALAALRQPFTVITGGPGTGKTTIVLKILLLMIEFHRQSQTNSPFRYKLVAPTGKAASRLTEAIRNRKSDLLRDKVITKTQYDLINDEASTIHRLLGYIPNSIYFKHNNDNKLVLDCLIVDEASMVDLALMSKLFSALQDGTAVILLGDENQLASVEAGSVLRDICLGLGRDEKGHSAIVRLARSYRFSSEQGIGKLSQLVNQGEGREAYRYLTESPDVNDSSAESDNGIVRWRETPNPTALPGVIKDFVLPHFNDLLNAPTVNEAFDIFDQFMILCAMRKGPYGVEEVNRTIERLLVSQNLIKKGEDWYQGKPILLTSNDYQLDLYNGDIGLAFQDKDSGNLKIHFKSEKGFKKYSPFRLHQYETAFALTVHKSQGSEYKKVMLLLPPEENPVLTKELIYTGITRARSEVLIMGEESSFIQSVASPIQRFSGLRYKLV